MNIFKTIGWWMFNNIPMGGLAPYWLGMLLGSWPRRIK